MSTAPTHQASIERDLGATLALACFSVAVGLGFARVFEGWGFVTDLVLVVIVGHGGSFVLRRLRVPGWIAVPGVALLIAWTLLELYYGATMRWLLPTSVTWDLIDLHIGLVRDNFPTEVAPVIYGTGWAFLAGVAMGVTILMSDSFAFRAEARGEALVPGGVLFVFIAALGDDRLRVTLTALLIAAGVVAVVALRAFHDQRRTIELRSARRSMSMAVPSAIAIAAVVAVIAGVIGPRIPGAHAEPLYDTSEGGNDTANVLSPLVDIRSRLTDRRNIEMFRVQANEGRYWRATTLAEFDGRIFREPARALTDIGATAEPVASDVDEIRQEIQIVQLAGRLVPAAADPVAGLPEGALSVLGETDALVKANGDLAPADLFTVVSRSPRLDPDQLRAATTNSPPDGIFLELPDLPPIVSRQAAEVTAGTTNSFDAAIALESWFREFEYSLIVQRGHDTSAIENFLNERIGYCEQFAATFAAMARTLGIPSRVAVGFTPGLVNDEGWYSVLGKNAHAWPELWFDGVGWVPFEPTPSRGNPAAQSYTGIDPQQDESGQEFSSEPITETSTPVTVPESIAPPVTTAPIGATPQTTAPLVPPGNLMEDGVQESSAVAADGSGSDGASPWRTVAVFALIVVVILMPLVVRRIRARAARSHDPVARVQSAWRRARVAAEQAGVIGRPSMTPHEWASATANQLPVAARPMASLADVMDRITFARPNTVDLDRVGSYGATLGHDCELWSQQITRIADDSLTYPQRIKQYFTDWR